MCNNTNKSWCETGPGRIKLNKFITRKKYPIDYFNIKKLFQGAFKLRNFVPWGYYTRNIGPYRLVFLVPIYRLHMLIYILNLGSVVELVLKSLIT